MKFEAAADSAVRSPVVADLSDVAQPSSFTASRSDLPNIYLP